MKKTFIALVATLIILAMLVGCAAEEEIPKTDGIHGEPNGNDGNGDSESNESPNGGSSENPDGGNTDTEGSNTDNDGGNTDNAGSNTDNDGGNTDTEGSNTDNDGGNTDNDGGNTDSDEELPPVGSEVGNLIESINLQLINGGSVSPDDYRGKIVILNIWATWCPPCVSELPDFDRFAEDYADRVVIIAAHDAYDNYNAAGFVNEYYPDTPIKFAYDTPSGDAFFAAGGDIYVPMTAILDERGVIVYSDSGPLSYAELVEIVESIEGE